MKHLLLIAFAGAPALAFAHGADDHEAHAEAFALSPESMVIIAGIIAAAIAVGIHWKKGS